ncbi:unnamed protein product [Microthlaspi erraticum]|uniref:Uncharacterized protein n=1 Tax=Microthlaspi erraticum TaxID=1685480 RepID=A0A6D2JS36_9BRAS|nr:unnamed protein product [Microthlaspi erraticum]
MLQTAISRNQCPNAQTGWPRNECSALGQNRIRPTDVSAKVFTTRPITRHDPGYIHPRSVKLQLLHATPHTTNAHDQGNKASRPRNPFRVPRPMHPHEPGKNVPRPAENLLRPSFNPLDHAGRPRINPTPTVPTRPRSDYPADHPARPSQRHERSFGSLAARGGVPDVEVNEAIWINYEA